MCRFASHLDAVIFVIIFGVSMDNDDFDDNPMHRIGYGRGDDHHVQIMPARVINVGEHKVEPTIPMEAVEIISVKDIVHRLVERNLQAWRALPEKIRDRMLERPQDFQLVPAKERKDGDFDWDILYSGTVWHYSGAKVAWLIQDIR